MKVNILKVIDETDRYIFRRLDLMKNAIVGVCVLMSVSVYILDRHLMKQDKEIKKLEKEIEELRNAKGE